MNQKQTTKSNSLLSNFHQNIIIHIICIIIHDFNSQVIGTMGTIKLMWLKEKPKYIKYTWIKLNLHNHWKFQVLTKFIKITKFDKITL